MRRFITGAMLLLATTFPIFSQTKNITIPGRVAEDTNKPTVQATIQLLPLSDNAYAADVATTGNGRFTLPKMSAGKYVLKVSYISFKNKFIPLHLHVNALNKNVGTVTLEADAVMLVGAVVTAEAPQVQVVENTLMYNSTAYRTPKGAMPEELVKKLPGAEVDDDGNVKINGKELKGIMVDGKESFGGDVKTGLKNLPVDMTDKLKTYNKQSDLVRITGIDNGEKEAVLDLTAKKGMNRGWFGNADLAYGTEDRYMARVMMNHFADKTKFSLIGPANNVNDQGSSGGGGGPRWRRNNGLVAIKTLGANFAAETSKLDISGSARYNYRGADIISTNPSERSLQNGNSYSNSNSVNRNENVNFNANFRLEWKPDSMTNITFRPNFSYGKTDNTSGPGSGTFNADPCSLVTNPNDFFNFDQMTDDPLEDIRVNATNDTSLSKSKSVSTEATLQLNRKLNDRGRNIIFRGRFSYDDNDNDQYSQSKTRYYQTQSILGDDSILYRNQYVITSMHNYNYSAQLTYSEPIARATFLQFRYQFQYKYSESDKTTFDMSGYPDWDINGPLPPGYGTHPVDSLGKYVEYRYYDHDAPVSLRFIREEYQLSAGMFFQPQHPTLSYKRGDYMIDTIRNVFNSAPSIGFHYRFSKVSQLRFMYRGRSSQSSMGNLLPIADNSDPLNVRVGNPGLKPAFTYSMRLFYNTYSAESQRGIVAHVNFSATQGSISNSTVYNKQTGGRITTPKNINGNWSAFGMFGFNTVLKNKKLTINSFSNINCTNNVSFLYNNDTKMDDKNTTTELALDGRLNEVYRNDWFEFGLNGSISYTAERSKLCPKNNQKPYTFSYGALTDITMPWKMTISTDITNQSRRGYIDSSMNHNELIWNAQLSQSFLKGAATVSFEMYDIPKQQSNISRSLTADARSASSYNGVNSYCMLHFIHRLDIFGSKSVHESMDRGPGGPGGQRGGFSRGHRPF